MSWDPIDLEVVLDRQRRRIDAGARPASRRCLNVGCGDDRRDGFVNVDRVAVDGVDAVAAFGPGGLPFADATFGLALCRDVLEHVDIVPALREIHRVVEPGGSVVISAVHFTSRNLYVDPTHVRGFSVRTFDFFAGATIAGHDRSYYFDFAFDEVERADIQFSTLQGNGRYLVWDRLVEPVVNRAGTLQDLYEMTFVARLFPAANVVAVLRR